MAATGARFRTTLGEPKPPDATIWGLLSMKLGLGSRRPAFAARYDPSATPCMAMVAIGVMTLGMMAGVIGRGRAALRHGEAVPKPERQIRRWTPNTMPAR